MQRGIRVCLSPALIGNYKLEQTTVVVIDILRATTSMCVAFGHGAAAMIPLETVEEAAAYRDQGYLVGAERNGEMIPGFDFGNSPYSYMRPLTGQRIAITTTNGTQAIHAARHAQQIVIGAFANKTVLTDYLLAQSGDVLLLCSGWKNNVNLEDTIFAGAMVVALASVCQPRDDAATISSLLYTAANQNKRYYLQNSTHYQRLLQLRLQADVKYCLRADTQPVLPIYRDGQLVNALPQPI